MKRKDYLNKLDYLCRCIAYSGSPSYIDSLIEDVIATVDEASDEQWFIQTEQKDENYEDY